MLKKIIHFEKKIIIFLCILGIISGKSEIFPDNPDDKWHWFNGEWIVENSFIIEKRGWVSPWNSYALLDYNSIVSIKAISDYSQIEFSLTFYNKPINNQPVGNRPLGEKAEFIASIAITSPSEKWYYRLYGFLFSGDRNSINKVSLVHSDMTDKTKKLSEKNNYFIKELTGKNLNLEYDKEHKIKIVINKNIAEIIINGKSALKGDLPDNNLDGRIGFSGRNIYMKIGNVKVSGKNGIILEDDFSKNSLNIRKLKVRKVDKQK